ncbi:MAG: hypothetical protein AAF447_11300, partial [Myxococcota bacterium]
MGCGGCEDDGAGDTALARAPGGSVANAENLDEPPVTDDGYQVIGASRQMKARAEAREQARRRGREDLVLEPTSPDPEAGDFTLEEAI